jgi:hypothetical protein
MKRFGFYFYCPFFLLLLFEGIINAQIAPPSNASCNIYAGIITVYSGGEKTPINFGKFSPGPQGCKITLSPQSTIQVQGAGFKGSGKHTAGCFYLSGDVASYNISLPTTPVVITHEMDSKTMLVDGWVSKPAPLSGANRLHDGSQIVFIGATLKVGTLKDNPIGIYTGSYAITFDFN